MISIRRGLFETNSSSVHSMVICEASDYDKWINGELLYNVYHDDIYEWKHWDPNARKYVDTTKGMPPTFVTPEQAAYWDVNYPYPREHKEGYWGGWDSEFQNADGEWCKYKFITFEEYQMMYGHDFETFTEEHTTPRGDSVVAFGYYGHD